MAEGFKDVRHGKFVAAIARGDSQVDAAIYAGYSKASAHVQASRLLKNPKIQAAVEELKGNAAEAAIVDVKWVLVRLKRIVKRCMEPTAILNSKGEPTGEYRFDSNGANRALELIGKHLKMFADVVKHEGLEGLAERLARAEKRVDGKR